MAREKNPIDTIQITLSVTGPIRDMLDHLSKGGFFGKNPADTAGMLLREKLRDLYAQGRVPGYYAPALPPVPTPGMGGVLPNF